MVLILSFPFSHLAFFDGLNLSAHLFGGLFPDDNRLNALVKGLIDQGVLVIGPDRGMGRLIHRAGKSG